jgi:hypothetical protein
MPLTANGRNDLLTNGLTNFTHIGALTALAPTEVAGGSYARQAVTWTAAAAGVRDNNAQISIPIPAATTVEALSVHSAVSAGNVQAILQHGSTLRGVATLQASDDIFRSDAHGLVNTDRVFLAAVSGEALPTPLAATTLYFVISSTTDTFQLSTTSGGASVAITTDGEVAWFKTVPETFTNAGNLVLATGAADIDSNFV